MDKYEFDNAHHVHTLNGKPLTGVTTVLGVIAKPMLIQWSANMAVEYIMNAIKEGRGVTSDVLNEAKTAHRKKKEEAGQKGTDIHAEVERLIKEALLTPTGQIEAYSGTEPQVIHFVSWAKENNVKFKATEEHVYSKTAWIGGIVDFICEIDGETYLGDIKTGSGIYSEAWLQISAYQICLEEMDLQKNIKGHIVLNLKKDGSFAEKRSISIEDSKKGFLAALELYRTMEKLNKTI